MKKINNCSPLVKEIRKLHRFGKDSIGDWLFGTCFIHFKYLKEVGIPCVWGRMKTSTVVLLGRLRVFR